MFTISVLLKNIPHNNLWFTKFHRHNKVIPKSLFKKTQPILKSNYEVIYENY